MEQKFSYEVLNNYSKLAERTRPALCERDSLLNAVMGLSGEAGEILEHVKKGLFQGHSIDKGKLVEELGDVVWYVDYLRAVLSVEWAGVLEGNVKKLEKRYPERVFVAVRSVDRGSIGDSF